MFLFRALAPLKARFPAGAKRPLKDGYGRALSTVARVLHRRCDPDDAVLLTSSPRSGSTWVMNVLLTLDRTCAVFEPLRPEETPRLRGRFPRFHPRIRPEQEAAWMRRYLDDVLRGAEWTRWSSNYAPIRKWVGARRFVVKFVRANRMWGWLGRNFPANRRIALVRHPCAVASSLLRSPGAWNEWPPEEILDPLVELFGPDAVRRLRERCRGRLGLFAAMWAADILCLLSESTPRDTLLLTYEETVRAPRRALDRVFAWLRTPVPDAAWRSLERPSETTNPGAAILERRDPILAWRERLGDGEVREILDVVHLLGVSFYGRDPEPDLEALSRAHFELDPGSLAGRPRS